MKQKVAQALSAALLLLTLAACGDDSDTATHGSETATLQGTVAYVATECIDTLDGAAAHQELRIIRGDSAPRGIVDLPTLGSDAPAGACTLFGLTRFGPFFLGAGVFQRLAVSPNGDNVIFEVTDSAAALPVTPLPPEEQGIFVVRADGTGRRRLGPASREMTYRLAVTDQNILINVFPGFGFSPNGRLVAFTDVGPDRFGKDAVQIVTVNVATGERRQVTQLPPAPSPGDLFATTCCPGFIDDDTLGFSTVADADGSNPNGAATIYTIKTDGSGLKKLPSPVLVPGSMILPIFAITGPRPNAALFFLPGEPENIPGTRGGIVEVFVVERDTLLQLTNFHRSDTGTPLLGSDRQHVFFVASANPAGINPTNNCQIFSVDRTGSDLRQLTDFAQEGTSTNGCFFGPTPGCAVAFLGQDQETDTLVTYSSCDPFGNNPYGSQIFALRPDGSGLRQLTQLRGVVPGEDNVTVELPGPFAFSTTTP